MDLKTIGIGLILALVVFGIYNMYFKPDCYNNRVYTEECERKMNISVVSYFGSISVISFLSGFFLKGKKEEKEEEDNYKVVS